MCPYVCTCVLVPFSVCICVYVRVCEYVYLCVFVCICVGMLRESLCVGVCVSMCVSKERGGVEGSRVFYLH